MRKVFFLLIIISSLTSIYSSEYVFWGLDFSSIKSQYTEFEHTKNNLGISLTVHRGIKLSYFNNTKMTLPVRLMITNGDDISLLSTPPLFSSSKLEEHLLFSELKHTQGVAYKFNFESTTLIPTLGFNATLTSTGIYKPISKFGPEIALYYIPDSKSEKSPFISLGMTYYLLNYEFVPLNSDEERSLDSSFSISLTFGTAHRWREDE